MSEIRVPLASTAPASPIQLLDLEMKVYYPKNSDANDRFLRLFSRLTDYQADYILSHLNTIQLWMFKRSKYSSAGGQKSKWKHPNNPQAAWITNNARTDNIAKGKMFPGTVYVYGASGQTSKKSGYGIGLESLNVPAPQLVHSETQGFVPTEFRLRSADIITLKDGSRALSINICLRNFTDNLAFTSSPGVVRMAGISAKKAGSFRNQKVSFKFGLTELKGDKKIDGRFSVQTVTAILLKSEGQTWKGPRHIGFSVI